MDRILDQRREKAAPDAEIDMTDVMDGLQRKARDHGRTPMQVLYHSIYPSNRPADDFVLSGIQVRMPVLLQVRLGCVQTTRKAKKLGQ
jgi:hypothetical protein